MAELEAVNRENSAKHFSERVKRFHELKNDKLEPTNFGLSGLALQEITAAHKKFSEGTGTVEDFEKVVKSVVENGLVEYGEHGSSLEEDVPIVDLSGTPGASVANRKAFMELVNKKVADAKKDGKEIEFSEAVKLATRENPELAKAYRHSVPA
jgi:hypothetical protein